MSEATPGPWRWFPNQLAVGPLKGAHIADVARTTSIADVLSRGGVGQERCEANAALIVKAVNAHDKLVAACALASEHEECVCEGKGECLGCVLQAALKEAKRLAACGGACRIRPL